MTNKRLKKRKINISLTSSTAKVAQDFVVRKMKKKRRKKWETNKNSSDVTLRVVRQFCGCARPSDALEIFFDERGRQRRIFGEPDGPYGDLII